MERKQRKLGNKGLYDLCSSLDIIRMKKPIMRRSGFIARMVEMRNVRKILIVSAERK
jgi:hypothetical protein